jgi:antitoxin VapB
MMIKSTVSTNNKIQVVRLPKAVALPERVRRVDIIKLGRGRLIVPVESSWDSFFDAPSASNDFMPERNQPKLPE